MDFLRDDRGRGLGGRQLNFMGANGVSGFPHRGNFNRSGTRISGDAQEGSCEIDLQSPLPVYSRLNDLLPVGRG